MALANFYSSDLGRHQRTTEWRTARRTWIAQDREGFGLLGPSRTIRAGQHSVSLPVLIHSRSVWYATP